MKYSFFEINNLFDVQIDNFKIPSVTMITDENQWMYAITNAFMILDQTSRKDMIKINIILVDLLKFKTKIYKKINDLNIRDNVKLYFVNSEDYIIKNSKLDHVTDATNIRLYLPEILQREKSTYYVDNDIVHEGDIFGLLRIFKDFRSYARRWNNSTPWISQFKKMVDNYPNGNAYFNAGAIHLPLKKMRENNFVDKVINFYNEKNDILKYADQDILNANLKINDGPFCMNVCRESWPKYYEEYSELINYKGTHFLSRIKQWDEFIFDKYEKSNGSLEPTELLNMQKQSFIWKKYHNKIWNSNIKNKIFEENRILILLTMHKFNNKEFEYWKNLYIDFEKDISFGIAFDGMIDEKFKNILIENKIIFSETGKNLGKISSVFNFIEKFKEILPKFTKIVDPDDQFDKDVFSKFVNSIKFSEINSSLISTFKLKSENEVEVKFWTSLATYNTIHLTKAFIDNKITLPCISKSSDCILGLVANNYSNVKKIDFPFYVYIRNNGISNVDTLSNVDKEKYLNELNKFIEFYILNEKINLNYEFNSSPSESEIIYIAKAISKEMNKKEYEDKIIEYFNIFKNITRANDDRKKKQKFDSVFLERLLKIWEENNEK